MVVHSSMHARKLAVLIVPHRLDDDNDDDNGNDYDDYGDDDDPKLYKRGKTKDWSAAVPTVHVYRDTQTSGYKPASFT